MWNRHEVRRDEQWEYRCRGCGQLRFHAFREKPTQCGNSKCDSKTLAVGRPGTLSSGMGKMT